MALSSNDLFQQSEFWAFLFVAGWVLLNWPMLAIAEGSLLWGVPTTLVYVGAVWVMIILMLFLFDRRNSS
jgi:NADH:ubiquinone oxidoreductase subunit 6 (subunit J)